MKKAFDTLSKAGQTRRLRLVAEQALTHFGLAASEMRPMGQNTNMIFRVTGIDGRVYMLRVCKPGWRTPEDLISEVVWLNALARETDLGAPVPVAARNGEYVVPVEVEGLPEARRCMLQTWLPGRPMGAALTETNLEKMGCLFAGLHRHGAALVPPPGFTRRRLDKIFVRGEEDLLFTPACEDAFTPRSRAVFEKTRSLVEETLQNLYADPAGLRVIHHDLWHGNIKIDHGRLRPFDFEDVVWGYPVQDIAPAMQDLMLDTPAERFEPLLAAFRRGYEQQAEWPETSPGQMDILRAERLLWVSNYVACFERPYLQGHIEWVLPLLEAFLQSGKLRKLG